MAKRGKRGAAGKAARGIFGRLFGAGLRRTLFALFFIFADCFSISTGWGRPTSRC